MEAGAQGIGALGIVLYGLVIVCGIGSVVCWIMTLIHIFRENVGLGILGIICGLFAFIYGWVKVGEYGNKKVMTWWTVFFLGSIVLQVLAVAVVGASMAGGMGAGMGG